MTNIFYQQFDELQKENCELQQNNRRLTEEIMLMKQKGDRSLQNSQSANVLLLQENERLSKKVDVYREGYEFNRVSLEEKESLIQSLQQQNKAYEEALQLIKQFANERKEINMYLSTVYDYCTETLSHIK